MQSLTVSDGNFSASSCGEGCDDKKQRWDEA